MRRKEGRFPSQAIIRLSLPARGEQLNLNTTSKEDHTRICLSGCVIGVDPFVCVIATGVEVCASLFVPCNYFPRNEASEF